MELYVYVFVYYTASSIHYDIWTLYGHQWQMVLLPNFQYNLLLRILNCFKIILQLLWKQAGQQFNSYLVMWQTKVF